MGNICLEPKLVCAQIKLAYNELRSVAVYKFLTKEVAGGKTKEVAILLLKGILP